MPYTFGVVDVDLNNALDRASTHKNAGFKIQAKLYSRMAVRGKLKEFFRQWLADECSGRYATVVAMRGRFYSRSNMA